LEWTQRSRLFNGLPPDIIPPLIPVYDDYHPEIIILKAAQIFISEFLLNSVLWCADTGWGYRGNALYVMPTQTHMDDFSKGRIATAIDQSPYLTSRVASKDSSSSIRMRKIAGRATYYRGAETIIQLRTIDADLVINDEVDQFVPGAVEKSKERLGSARLPLYIAASQPTYPEVGIDALFAPTDQRRWFIKCERCNKEQTLTWDENVVFDEKTLFVDVVCVACRRPINRFGAGHWQGTNPNPTSSAHGYHLSKLYSHRANLQAMLERFLAVEDIEKIQTFYTADLGIPYRPRGSKSSVSDFKREVYDWKRPVKDSYAGIDVGNVLHLTIIGRDNRSGDLSENPFRVIEQHTCLDFDELEEHWKHYLPRMTVIDARGDPRATFDWAEKHIGRVYRHEHVQSFTEPMWYEDDSQKVKQDRTAMLDTMYTWLRQHQLICHLHASKDFYAQLTAPVREIVKGKDGRLVPRYIGERADHYAFSTAYAVLAATEFSVGRSTGQVAVAPRATEPSVAKPNSSSIMKLRPSWSGSSSVEKRRWP